ncbi:MAG TPA: hypothetical protein P5096_01910 [Patescibacteria group bacterium]|nr:hypothetical protein [Patescibacteria group bacterium]
MEKFWLNQILKTSSYIYRIKEKIRMAGNLATTLLCLWLIIVEVYFFLISLPSYLFIKKTKGLPKEEIKVYKLKREISFIFLFILLFLIAIFAFLTLTVAPNSTAGQELPTAIESQN